ncbi:MAG: DsbA family protein [Anaerolineales bacterium]|nr:DsbA family protein [Anaerolineales bacterium]
MKETNTPSPQIEDQSLEGAVVGSEPTDTLTFKRAHLYAVLLPLAFVAGLALGFVFWGRAVAEVPQTAVRPTVEPSDTQPQEITRYNILEDDDPVFGPEDAPITIIEFSDFECPYCRKWHLEVWPRLLEAYPDQIRLVYRDFPLTNIHANATPAASAANCAGEQGEYWAFNDLLFSMRLDLNKTSYHDYADELGLDVEAFDQCLESGRHNAEVMADLEYAANLGISSTPTFFVNGIPVVGAQPFEVFSQLISKELAGEIP